MPSAGDTGVLLCEFVCRSGTVGGAIPARANWTGRSCRFVNAGDLGDPGAYHPALGERETDIKTGRQPAWFSGSGEDFPLPRWICVSLRNATALEAILGRLEGSSRGV